MKKLLFLSLLLFSEVSLAFCPKELEEVPILQNGRVKPLYIHSKEVIKYLTGKSSVSNIGHTRLYCLLSVNKLKVDLTTPIGHIEVKKLLSLDNSKSRFTYKELTQKREVVRSKLMRMQEPTSLKNALNNLFNKIATYDEINSGINWKYARLSGDEITWSSARNLLSDEQNFDKNILNSKEVYIKKSGDKYLLELTYAKLNLTMLSLVFVIISLITLVISKTIKIPLGFSIVTLTIQLFFLAFRTVISGRPPLTNMYESVIFSGFAALFLGIIFSAIKKDKILLLVGLICNLCTLFMINFSGQMFSSSIGPLVPVLKDNFWLSTHVSAVIIAYGALGLSWILSNIVLIQKRFLTLDSEKEKYYAGLIHLCLKFGVTFLAAGILLGAIWADYAWGRFWGWDPKETWSLITLFVYMIILHGRFSTWIKTPRFIMLTALAFMSVMMAWFGVNYILATGLHSYGHSQGGTIFLISFFTVQSLVVLITTKTRKKA